MNEEEFDQEYDLEYNINELTRIYVEKAKSQIKPKNHKKTGIK
jgi:hypothetical protein